MGRLFLGLFEVGLGLLLIILDATSTIEQIACARMGVSWRDGAHPPGFPDAQSTQGKTGGLTENAPLFIPQGEELSRAFSSRVLLRRRPRKALH